jgi:glutathione synthase/RimK-type ligase-like ATP-grasp enzyme
MQYNFVLLRTDNGGRYARKILNSIKWINEHKYPQHDFQVKDITISEFIDIYEDGNFGRGFERYNTIIHPRCANPKTKWTEYLRSFQNMGYKVVNSVDCIELTSNKLACSLHLQGKVNHPKSWEYRKNMSDSEFDILINEIYDNFQEYIIAKPLTSLEQGANVKKLNFDDYNTIYEIRDDINKVPGNKIVIQEYIPYTALHRVIVINNKALPYTFIDKPEWHPNDWKVSCCLNRTTMKLNENANPELLELAEQTQKEIGGVVNFIDIFEVDNGQSIYYTNAEINTACSLNIHEKLARDAGRNDWNVHYRIANQLVKELLGE